ncbi:hypothetical protein [Streptomyces jumonjinensis]|uniref:hypothetical protein n=1 Tax=Streptomyces jumonjinensis TaxID=1945 RepID=UPI001E48DE12|nr:hypothetical protein [Streptomyces jumonjinensis]
MAVLIPSAPTPWTGWRRPAASSPPCPTPAPTATTGRTTRDEAGHVLREASRLGIEHQVQLDVLSASGVLA